MYQLGYGGGTSTAAERGGSKVSTGTGMVSRSQKPNQ